MHGFPQGGPVPFLYFGVLVLAWMIVWRFVFHAFLAQHTDAPWAQGLSSLV